MPSLTGSQGFHIQNSERSAARLSYSMIVHCLLSFIFMFLQKGEINQLLLLGYLKHHRNITGVNLATLESIVIVVKRIQDLAGVQDFRTGSSVHTSIQNAPCSISKS